MVKKIRRRLALGDSRARPRADWFSWLAPLAAAAMLAFALVSFQSRAPVNEAGPTGTPAPRIAPVPPAREDPQLTQIMALDANLAVDADMTKLESVDSLAFLFD